VNDKEQRIKNLRTDIKRLKSDLVKLKNEIIVNEKESESKTETTIEDSGLEKSELDMIEVEKQKNEDLLILGKKIQRN
jgi:cell division septum initiation protein DivIVA